MKTAKSAIPLDVNGKRLKIGDTVVANDLAATWRRNVEDIYNGDAEALRGSVRVSGSIAWESARNFVRVQS